MYRINVLVEKANISDWIETNIYTIYKSQM